MEEDVAINVSGVYKNFRLPHEKADSVKHLFTNIFRSKNSEIEVQHALKNISFTVKKGEFFGIVGRNGSGKSTLLKLIAGIYQPNKGSVSINGRLVPFIELGVGFNPELTGRENVYLNGALMGFSTNEIKNKYKDIVKFAELERFMDQKLKNYSSGMQVRLAFSVATILAESDILLIDEVLAVGDADFQRKCFEYFRKLKKNKKTVIFVSHDMSAIREYCDRAVLIDESKVIFSGTSEQVSKEYTKLFLPEVYKEELGREEYERIMSERSRNDGKWGVGFVDITSIKTSKAVYKESDKKVVITYDITSHASEVIEIIPGLMIKNEKGDPICGSNSDITEDLKAHVFIEPKQVVSVSWEVPNVFNEGILTIEPAVISRDGETLQWWDDATTFRVVNKKKTPYAIAPDIRFKTL